MNLPATLRPLREIVAEYDAKAAALPEALATFRTAIGAMNSAGTIGGEYVGEIVGARSEPYESSVRATLLKSAWRHVYKGLNIPMLATAGDRKKFDLALENPPPFTIDNIRATFGGYVKDPRFHILKGLAEVFTGLDPAYKSHSKVKIGVAGLPKRVIITNVGDHGGWGEERLKDMLNALNFYEGRPHLGYAGSKSPATAEAPEIYHPGLRDILDGSKGGDGFNYFGTTITRYKNGNAHIAFSPDKLVLINRAIAEFYGDVLPDMATEAPTQKQPSTAVAKDLQYYPTPNAVIDQILRNFGFREGWKVLEPSCGDGRIMDALRKRREHLLVTGVEVDPGRAAEARAKGHHVLVGNFLQCQPDPVWDLILMNPPFYGRHWKLHLGHALKFLKPGGHLVCILPATAYYDHGDLPGEWHDLPVASFAESGTNIPTGYLTCYKRPDR